MVGIWNVVVNEHIRYNVIEDECANVVVVATDHATRVTDEAVADDRPVERVVEGDVVGVSMNKVSG